MIRRVAFPAFLVISLGFLIAAGFLAVTAFLGGCSDPTRPKPPQSCSTCLVPRTSPANVLQNLRVYYSIKDNSITAPDQAHQIAEEYRTLLHPDFKFYFLPNDVPPYYPQGWWGREPEVFSLDSLLTRKALGSLTDIKLSWNPGPDEPDNRMGAPPKSRHIKVNLILLDVIQGDVTYRVNNGVADFYFVPDPTDTTLYVITEWYDRQSTNAPIVNYHGNTALMIGAPTPSTQASTTWGRIKGLYH